jgi:predicted RNase H-like nuclease (RuvC/YqgF family)
MSSASSVSPVSVNNEREIQPMDLSIEQLNNLKQQHEEEIRELQRQLEQLSGQSTLKAACTSHLELL